MLLDNDADVNSLVNDESTFFEAAFAEILRTAQSNEAFSAEDETRVIDLTKRMLEMDVDLSRRNAQGDTPLHWVTDAHDAVYDGLENDLLLTAFTELLLEYEAPAAAENEFLPAGATESYEVELVAGEFGFYCSVPGHEAAGMVGSIVVS